MLGTMITLQIAMLCVVTQILVFGQNALESNAALESSAQEMLQHVSSSMDNRDYKKAIKWADQLCRLLPQDPQTHSVLADALAYDSQHQLAANALENGIHNFGHVLLYKKLGQLFQYMTTPPDKEKAIRYYAKYLEQYWQDAGIHNDIGLLLAEQNRVDAAINHYRAAISLDSDPPSDYRVRTNLGLLLVKSYGRDYQKRNEGLKLEREAIDIARKQSNSSEVARKDLSTLLLNMGSLLDSPHFREESNVEESIHYWDEALALNPKLTICLDAVGNKHAGAGDIVIAYEYFNRAIKAAKAPENMGTQHFGTNIASAIRIKAATLLPRVYDSSNDIMEWRWKYVQQLQLLLEEDQSNMQIVDPARAALDMGYYLVYQGLDNRGPREMLAEIYLRACPSLAGDRDQDNLSSFLSEKGEPTSNIIRVGFFSEYWNEHSTTKLLVGVIEGLTRSEHSSNILVELISTASAPRDHYTDRLESAVYHVTTVPGVSNLAESRKMIRQLKLDILVFAEIGMGMAAYFLSFSAKTLARRSVMFWGHGVTSGINAIDFFVTSRMFHGLTGSGRGLKVAQAAWTEHLYAMNSVTTAFERPPDPDFSIDLKEMCNVVGEDPHFYLAPTSLYKFHPLMDIPLAQVLIRDPNGVLIIVQGNEPRWASKIVTRIQKTIGSLDLNSNAASRIVVVPSMPREKYLAFLRAGHVVALPFPTTSSVTAFETIASGTPFVTYGASSSSYLLQHYAPAFLAKMGMTQDEAYACCVASDLDDYAQKLIRFGTDKQFRATISEYFRQESHHLFGGKAHSYILGEWVNMLKNILMHPRPVRK